MSKKSRAHRFGKGGVRPLRLSLCIVASALLLLSARTAFASENIDVTHYDALLEPDLRAQTIRGEVSVTFRSLVNDLREVVLDAQELQIKGVSEGGAPVRFESKEGRLIIRLERAARAGLSYTLKISYEGKPARGLKFYEDHLYAAYNTPRWMVCNFEPGDKATLTLRLILPENFRMVANGQPSERKRLGDGRARHVWRERASVPPFVYGFAAGSFQQVVVKKGRTRLFYLARSIYTPAEVERIFADTPGMLRFFEARAGVPYPQGRYTQVLASGNTMQEMSAFTVLRENYGREVLAEPRENWLIAHELAHQWWGVRVTCASWADFWLNEGFAEFMMSAYRERRNGRDEYDRDMEMARSSYARLRAASRDRPLAFREPVPESRAGGPIVYDKGTLVLSLLRYEIGEDAFWRGLRLYTSRNFGRNVVTPDLQKAMEEASGKSLKTFFEQWVYGAGVPEVVASHRVEGGEVIIELEQRGDVLWNLSFQVAVETSRGRESRRVNLKERRVEARFRLAGNLLSVRVDDGGHLPFRLKQEGRPLSMLLYQLAHEPDTAGRAEALDQIQSLLAAAKDESTKAQLRAALAERAAQDSTRLIRALAKKALEK